MREARCIAKIAYRTYGSYTFVKGRDPGFDYPLHCLVCDLGYDGYDSDCTCSEPGWIVGVYQGKSHAE